jgi:hypothetical protein
MEGFPPVLWLRTSSRQRASMQQALVYHEQANAVEAQAHASISTVRVEEKRYDAQRYQHAQLWKAASSSSSTSNSTYSTRRSVRNSSRYFNCFFALILHVIIVEP